MTSIETVLLKLFYWNSCYMNETIASFEWFLSNLIDSPVVTSSFYEMANPYPNYFLPWIRCRKTNHFSQFFNKWKSSSLKIVLFLQVNTGGHVQLRVYISICPSLYEGLTCYAESLVYNGGLNETVSKILQRNWCNCFIFLIGPNETVTVSFLVLM